MDTGYPVISWIFLLGSTPKKRASSTCGRFGGQTGLCVQLAVIAVADEWWLKWLISGLSVRRVIDRHHR